MSSSKDHSSGGSKDQNAKEEQKKKLEEKYILDLKRHAKYFMGHIMCLPHQYSGQDLNRVTLLYFAVSGLDVLGILEETINDKMKKEIIDWLYDGMLLIDTENVDRCGFRGGSFLGTCFQGNQTSLSSEMPSKESHSSSNSDSNKNNVHQDIETGEENVKQYDTGHLAMTYTALAVLRILGDDLKRLKENHYDDKILEGLKKLQNPDTGCFKPVSYIAEEDVRFLYCASVICALLDRWDICFDRLKALEFLQKSRCYDSAYSHGYGFESHSGSTYCAISTLTLLSKYDSTISSEAKQQFENELKKDQRKLVEWLLRKQISGFCGRPHKDPDTCYSFWVGASLAQLGAIGFVDTEQTVQFTFSCQNGKYGGFSKYPHITPDILHSYMALCGLSLCGYPGLREIVPELGITKRAASAFVKK